MEYEYLSALREDREDLADTIKEIWHRAGSDDCKEGRFPRHSNQDYIEGFLTELRKLPIGPDGEIEVPGQKKRPTQQFAYGWVDTPHGEAWA